jgi:hypothetical protein
MDADSDFVQQKQQNSRESLGRQGIWKRGTTMKYLISTNSWLTSVPPPFVKLRTGFVKLWTGFDMLKSFADWLVFTIMGLTPGTRSGEALDFFIYDMLKIFLLLTTIIFVVAITAC